MLPMRTGTLFLVALLTILATQAHLQFADSDLWGRLAGASLWFGSGHFPYFDSLSFTANGHLWVDHEWLSSVVFYGVLRAGGETALLLFKDLVVAACLGLLFWMHRKVYRVSPFFSFFGILFLSPLIDLSFVSTVRCQMFSFLFFLGFLAWLEDLRLRHRSAWRLAALVPFGILWANLHGGFVMGVLLLLGYGVGAVIARRSPVPHLLTVAAIFAGVAFANPYGPRYLTFLARAWTMDRSDIIEWLPLWSRFSWERVEIGVVVVIAVVLGARALIARQPSARTLRGPALVLLGLAAMAVRSYRFKAFLAFGGLALFPVFLPLFRFERLRDFSAQGGRWIERLALMIGASSLLVLGSSGSHPLTAPLPPKIYPLDQIAYLRAIGASGNIATPFSNGEFAAWALYPKIKVATDGRFEEVYSLEEVRSWLKVFKTPENPGETGRWAKEHGADWIIVPRIAEGAIHSLQECGLWKLALMGGEFALYARNGVPAPNASEEETAPTIADFFTSADLARFTP